MMFLKVRKTHDDDRKLWFEKRTKKKQHFSNDQHIRKPPLKSCLSKRICPSLVNGPVPRNLVDSFMFLVAYQCRMCENGQYENAASATRKLKRGKSRVDLTRIGRKVTGEKSKKERKKKVERSRDDSG